MSSGAAALVGVIIGWAIAQSIISFWVWPRQLKKAQQQDKE